MAECIPETISCAISFHNSQVSVTQQMVSCWLHGSAAGLQQLVSGWLAAGRQWLVGRQLDGSGW